MPVGTDGPAPDAGVCPLGVRENFVRLGTYRNHVDGRPTPLRAPTAGCRDPTATREECPPGATAPLRQRGGHERRRPSRQPAVALAGKMAGSSVQAAFGLVVVTCGMGTTVFNFLVDGVVAKVGTAIGARR